MKRILFSLLVVVSYSATAQFTWDYGIKLGAANYLGDIGGFKEERNDFVVDMHLPQTRYAIGAYGRYKLSKRLAIAGNFDHILIQDADKYTSYAPRRARNLNFRNRMFELGARAELTVWYDNDVGNRGYYNPDYKLYIFGGLAAFYHNPQARWVYDAQDTIIADLIPGDYVDGNWYNLRNLQTEGKKYGAVGLALPLGIGMYFTFKKEWRIGWEFCWRTTFTDYLDDVSGYYDKPTAVNPDDQILAENLQSQTYQGLLDEVNKELPYVTRDNDIITQLSLVNFTNNPGAVDEGQTIRGLPTNNDSYITTQITLGKVIRGRSKFYKSKYSWVRTRSTVRRSRAKF